MKKKIKLFLSVAIFLGSFLVWQSVQAACLWNGNTGTVASPYNYTDVQDCVTDAASRSGAVVISIPACNVNWSSAVIVDMSTGWTGSSLTIQGAGAGVTNIVDTTTAARVYNVGALFHLKSASGKSIRLTALSVSENSISSDCLSSTGLIYVYGNGTQSSIDNISIPDLRNATYQCTGLSLHEETGGYGVVYNSTFTVPYVVGEVTWTGNPIKIIGTTDDSGWTDIPFTPGTANAWYIEGNTFYTYTGGNGCWDSYGAARTVHRYNTMHGCGVGGHGNDSGSYSSVHTQEIYNNLFDMDCGSYGTCGGDGGSRTAADLVNWRGGTGVMFNNVFSGSTSVIHQAGVAENYRGCPDHYGTAANTDNSTTTLISTIGDFDTAPIVQNYYIYNQSDHSYCAITSHTDTTITCAAGLAHGTTNRWNNGDVYAYFYYSTFQDDMACDGLGPNDRNFSGQQGWLCKQQIGSTYEGGAYTYKPLYAWNNTYGGNSNGNVIHNPSFCSRDAIYQTVAGQTFFDCASAADCKTQTDITNVPGFGYNQGWLYPGPYTCPHPLTGLTGSCDPSVAGTVGYNIGATDTTPPAAPSGLAVS